jgi:hypothetical protein
MSEIVPDTITAALLYDSETGRLFWRANGRAGREAGHIDADGYRVIRLSGRLHRAHRLIWVLAHNEAPPPIIDHVNGNRTDNRPENLRAATHQQNMVNRGPARKNVLRMKGVRQRGARWLSQITHNRRAVFLGSYPTAEEAGAAYAAASRRLHGEFANLGNSEAAS